MSNLFANGGLRGNGKSKRVVSAGAVSKHVKVPSLPGCRFSGKASGRFHTSVKRVRVLSEKVLIHKKQHGGKLNRPNRGKHVPLETEIQNEHVVFSPVRRTTLRVKKMRVVVDSGDVEYIIVRSWKQDPNMSSDGFEVTNIYSCLYVDSSDDEEVVSDPPRRMLRGGGAFSAFPDHLVDVPPSNEIGQDDYDWYILDSDMSLVEHGSIGSTHTSVGVRTEFNTRISGVVIERPEYGFDRDYVDQVINMFSILCCGVVPNSTVVVQGFEGLDTFVCIFVTAWGVYFGRSEDQNESEYNARWLCFYDLYLRTAPLRGGAITNKVRFASQGGKSKKSEPPTAKPGDVDNAKKVNAKNDSEKPDSSNVPPQAPATKVTVADSSVAGSGKTYSDISINCRACLKSFVFKAADQISFERNNWSNPRYCKFCRGSSQISVPISSLPVKQASNSGSQAIDKKSGSSTTVPAQPQNPKNSNVQDNKQHGVSPHWNNTNSVMGGQSVDWHLAQSSAPQQAVASQPIDTSKIGQKQPVPKVASKDDKSVDKAKPKVKDVVALGGDAEQDDGIRVSGCVVPISQDEEEHKFGSLTRDEVYSAVAALKLSGNGMDRARLLNVADRRWDNDDFILKRRFVSVEPPNCKLTFTERGHVGNCRVVNLYGAPFCGLNVISRVLKLPCDVKSYMRYIPKVVTTAYAAGIIDDDELRELVMDCVGMEDWLAGFAGNLGYGLRVSSDTGVEDHHNTHLKEYIWLYHTQAFGGHWQLVVNGQCDVEHYTILTLPEPEPVKWRWPVAGAAVIASLALLHPVTAVLGFASAKAASVLSTLVHTLDVGVVAANVVDVVEDPVLGEVLYEEDNTDRRSIQNRREDIKYQDSYRRVDLVKHVTVLGKRVTCFDTDERYRWLMVKEFLVSQTLFTHLSADLMVISKSSVSDPLIALRNVTRYRELNTDVNKTEIVSDTLDLLRWFSFTIPRASQRRRDFRGLVSLNAPGEASIIPNQGFVVSNQLNSAVLKGEGSGLVDVEVREAVLASLTSADGAPTLACDAHGVIRRLRYDNSDKPSDRNETETFNHVVKYRLERGKENEPVCVAPIGPLTNKGKVIGPGLFSLTDSPSTLAAFVGRMMTKDRNIDPELDRFLEFAKKFLETYVENTDVTDNVEIDGDAAFERCYLAKKGRSFVNRHIDQRHKYLAGEMSEKEELKYLTHGCFVKFESNIKRSKTGGVKPRPRMIMTMSDCMLYECCQVMELIHSWNAGPFGKYQIKDMEPSEMIEKIMSVSDRPHVVTDYSSFESSIDDRIRELEVGVMVDLCEKASFSKTREAILNHCLRSRRLKCKWGEFSLTTRCSGDFWTSFGNGIVNVCVCAYCASRRGYDVFDMVAEGDDGLIPIEISDPETVKAIGIKFSCELYGTQPGDCDFLKSRWMDGKRYLNVGATLAKSLWVKGGHKLKRSKQMFILRCIGNSLYHLSPGHPVLTALVNRIGKETSGLTPFKNYTNYLDRWKNLKHDEINIRHVEVDESMRMELARGAHGFPPIEIPVQLALEESIEKGDFDLYGLLDDYSEIQDLADSWVDSEKLDYNSCDMKRVVGLLNSLYVSGSERIKVDSLVLNDFEKSYTYKDHATYYAPTPWFGEGC